MNNLKQITNFDVLDAPSIVEEIIIGGETINYNYKQITLIGNITKLGYCCEVKGIGYPIFLTFNNTSKKKFEIGKTGMFEFQEEQWKNINDIESEEQTAIVYCIEVEVPEGIKFTLDYFDKQ